MKIAWRCLQNLFSARARLRGSRGGISFRGRTMVGITQYLSTLAPRSKFPLQVFAFPHLHQESLVVIRHGALKLGEITNTFGGDIPAATHRRFAALLATSFQQSELSPKLPRRISHFQANHGLLTNVQCNETACHHATNYNQINMFKNSFSWMFFGSFRELSRSSFAFAY